MALLLCAGCSGKNEENDGQDQIPSETRNEEPEAGQKEHKERKELKQAELPQFIPNGIRSVSLTKDGEEFLHISREPAEYKMQFDYWEILNPYDENVTMNTEVMFEMYKELCGLAFDTPVQPEEGTDTGISGSDMEIGRAHV